MDARLAVGYLRVSSMGQIDGDGFDRQIAAIEGYVAENRISVATLYKEEGIPGKNELQNRPALSRLLGDLTENGETKTVIIEKLDRLARDVIVQENIIRHMQARGIEILSASPAEVGLCDDNPTRKFIRVVLGASAQLEKDLIILRTKVARERIRSNCLCGADRSEHESGTGSCARTGCANFIGCRCEGRKPFGEHPNHEDEPKALSTMRRMRQEGYTYANIANWLSRGGFRTRYGRAWHAATVNKILKRNEKKTSETGEQARRPSEPTHFVRLEMSQK